MGFDEEDIRYNERCTELINKFNAEFIKKHLNHDPMFRTCFEMLLRRTDPYKIIESLIEDRIRLQESIVDIVNMQRETSRMHNRH